MLRSRKQEKLDRKTACFRDELSKVMRVQQRNRGALPSSGLLAPSYPSTDQRYRPDLRTMSHSTGTYTPRRAYSDRPRSYPTPELSSASVPSRPDSATSGVLALTNGDDSSTLSQTSIAAVRCSWVG